MADLLPPSASPESRQRAEVMARLSEIPVPVRHMWNPQAVPAPFLPYLAWAMSVDYWNPDWDEATKRRVIAASWDTHAYKGTIHAIEEAVATLGFSIELEEWFQNERRRRGTFGVHVQVVPGSPTLTTATQRDIEEAIIRAKRASQHHDMWADVELRADTGVACGGLLSGILNRTGALSGRSRLRLNSAFACTGKATAVNNRTGVISGRTTLTTVRAAAMAATLMIKATGVIT